MKLLFLLLTFTLASPKEAARIVVAPSEPEHVLLAAQDLASDVRTISGRELKIVRSAKAKKGDVFVSTAEDGRWEAYEVGIKDGVLRFTGSDSRGTMFAIYDFCENYLGVDPMIYWNQAKYPKMDTLAWDEVKISQGSPTVKFRGWFINDEDLLTGWLEPSGPRHTTYKYYHTVINHDIAEHMAESLVRSRYNLIIPASLMWALNPPEQKILDICAKRGVFLSMHHIEPLGVSAFSFEYYWEQKGKKGIPFSYVSSRAELEEIWRETAKVWAKYPNVIWQIGLRGVGDRPMWETDSKIPQSDAERAAIISDAMKRQLEILDEIGVPREGRLTSTTLWAEGSIFNDKGLLTIPEGTKIIFADNCPGWKWQNDFRTTVRKPNLKYGVYYHHALIGAGPHLASLVPASKTYELMKQAVDTGAGDYAIFNVSDLREFSYNIDATSKMLWNMDSFRPEKWTAEWVSKHYSTRSADWLSVYNTYYRSLQIHPYTNIPAFLDGMLQGRINRAIDAINKGKDSASFPSEPFTSGPEVLSRKDAFWLSMYTNSAAKFVSSVEEYSLINAQMASYKMAMDRADALYATLPESEKPFALTTIVYPSRLMYHMSKCYCEVLAMVDAVKLGNKAEAVARKDAAFKEISAAVDLEAEYCTGRFTGWWNDCRKVNLKAMKDKVNNVKL